MAVVQGRLTMPNRGGLVYTATLAVTDTSNPFEGGNRNPAVAWQVTGTFGTGGSIQLEKSNDGVNFVPEGAARTAAGMNEASTAARFLRFNVTAGDGTTALTATLFATGTV